MFGVFFMSETLKLSGMNDQEIYSFETEAEAYEFIAKKLDEAGEISISDQGTYTYDFEDYTSAKDVVEEFQTSLEGLEFLHVYPLVAHFATAPAT